MGRRRGVLSLLPLGKILSFRGIMGAPTKCEGGGVENRLSRPGAGSSLRAVASCSGAAISMVVNRVMNFSTIDDGIRLT